jgi:hypothetical protein
MKLDMTDKRDRRAGESTGMHGAVNLAFASKSPQIERAQDIHIANFLLRHGITIEPDEPISVSGQLHLGMTFKTKDGREIGRLTARISKTEGGEKRGAFEYVASSMPQLESDAERILPGETRRKFKTTVLRPLGDMLVANDGDFYAADFGVIHEACNYIETGRLYVAGQQ